MAPLYKQLVDSIDYNLEQYEHFRYTFGYIAFQYLASAERYAGKLAELTGHFDQDRTNVL